jgi:hypothetical protein
MRCRTARILITQQLREALLPEPGAALTRHLDRCARCRTEEAALRQFAARLLHDRPAPTPSRAPVAAGWTRRQMQAHPRPPAILGFPPAARRLAPLGAALTAVVVLAFGLAHVIREPGGSSGRAAWVVDRSDVSSRKPGALWASSESAKGKDKNKEARKPGDDPSWFPGFLIPNSRPSPLSRFRDKDFPAASIPQRLGSAASQDDLVYMNAAPAPENRQWVPLSAGEWQALEDRVRQRVRVQDDFVTIPFPRIAAASDRAVVAATEAYQREAAIVDARLAREVTCAFKATALSDLCDRLRSDTGIQLVAGNSVADEKVIVFCEKLPLRDVMRQLSRPFGYTWLRSGTPGAYRYELVQDLKSQLLEEELRNRDRNQALLALEKEIERYRPYLNLTPDEALARAKSAAPAEKKLLETLSGKGWAGLQMYARLSARDQAGLRAGQQVRFMTKPGPGDQPLPPEIQKGVLQVFRDWKVVRDGDVYKMAWEPDTPGGVSAETLSLSITEAYVGLQLGQSELGRMGLHGDVYWSIPGSRVGGGGSGESFVEAVSPTVARPDNRAANAKLARDPAFRARVAVEPGARREAPDASPAETGRDEGAEPTPASASRLASSASKKVTTADVLEALHRATGMPVVADYYTRLFKPETVSARGLPLFEALNELCETMRLRWNQDEATGAQSPPASRVLGDAGGRAWLQFRSASYYDDRLKEVPNRLLNHWVAARRKHGALTLDDLCEIAQLPDAQLNGREMGEGARELFGLKEWDLGNNLNLRGSLRLLAGFAPARRQEATTAAGLAFTQMSLAQQQRYIALAFETSGQPLQSLDDLTGATLRVEYTQPGGFQWGDPNHPGCGFYTRWVAPLDLTPRGHRVPRPPVLERTREAALQAVRRVDPPLRQALLQAARRGNPRLDDSPRAVEDDQIFPTKLNLTIVYIPGATNVRGLHVRCLNANYNPALE